MNGGSRKPHQLQKKKGEKEGQVEQADVGSNATTHS
jgi:hypothetical protein